MKLLKPPPKLTISEWADKERRITAGNAEPGPWRTARVPYTKEPMDVCADPTIKQVSLMWAAQTAKTESCCNNVIGYYIAHNPQSIIVMHPTKTDVDTWCEGKLNPLINDTPAVAARVSKPRSRDGVNTKTLKSFVGGFLFTAWSGSSNTMRGRSAPTILCDEIDGYEMTSEGDPLGLIWRRAATFGDRRKMICTSTPTIKGYSRIEKRFNAGDRRYYHVPCVHCGESQRLEWSQIFWDKNEDGEHLPETARYVCKHCGCEISDSERIVMLRNGEWIAEAECKGHASFHLNFIYSPFLKFEDMVTDFLTYKSNGDMQSFVNTCLAETWDEEGERIDDGTLYSRREKYAAPVPDPVILLTAGVDVQADRLELEVVGWLDGEESYNVDYRVLWGDPSQQQVWDDLDDVLRSEYRHESGNMLKILSTCIDSGGNHTQIVYDYVKARKSQRIFAIKGVSGEGRPIVSAPSKKQTGRDAVRKVELFLVGVDDAKITLHNRLKIDEPGPGYCHFPMDRDEEYFKQLTAERLVTRYVKGVPVKRVWQKTRTRNEALDCRNYALAALKILNPVWSKLRARIEAKAQPEPEPVEEVQEVMATARRPKRRPQRRNRSGGFVNRWK